MGEVGDASNFKEYKKVGLQFAHAVFLFLGGFSWNDLFSRADQQPIKLCIAQIHVGRLLPGFVRLKNKRL
jgi:hypothetical protein